MLRIERILPAGAGIAACARRLTLRYADRCKSRLRVTLDDGTEVGLFLPRGTVLRGGDVLLDEQGAAIDVRAAREPLYEVTASIQSRDRSFDLLRAAYHLGNRHVPVQLSPGLLRLERDPVLKELLLRLGLQVIEIDAIFDPEAGAYGGGHRHDHDTSGGSLGERLSREAHAGAIPDFSRAALYPAT